MNIAASPATTYVPFDALQADLRHAPSPLRAAITAACRRDEATAVSWLLAQGVRVPDNACLLAHRLVSAVRAKRSRASGVDALMHEFSLSSEEGVALMCLAEALLRIPDAATADRLIADKIGKGDWKKHLGESPSLFVNAATWGLIVTGKLVSPHGERGLGAALTRLIARGGEPLVRKGVDLAMRLLGNQFVTGRTIEEALDHSRANERRGYRYSYDMLGEAALTAADAERYGKAYETAIHAIGQAAQGRGIRQGPGISIKLSALHPRYSRAQRTRVMAELLPRLRGLALLAKAYDIGLNIDAEEADRLELSLDLFEALAVDPALDGYEGLGLVVQAYQKRCPFVIDWLIDLARRTGRRFMVRLVKGAYWDAEIKRAQVDGLPGYPVYTRKAYTDVSYLTCAKKLLNAAQAIYPQFATHNAHSLAVIHTWAQQAGVTDYEFQCLHGMGEALYDEIVGPDKLDRPCRIYAPVGSHETLLAYLVRRLLENGANTSFVNQIVDEHVPIATLLADPFETARTAQGLPHPRIPLPANLFPDGRRNSAGIDLADDQVLTALARDLGTRRAYLAAPFVDGLPSTEAPKAIPVVNPAQHADIVGQVVHAAPDDVEAALRAAQAQEPVWARLGAQGRATVLERVADLYEASKGELMALAVREAGKSLPNAVAEVREAVDFLRYYAASIRRDGQDRVPLGPVACISPWNFPLAIFTGQIAAALAAGNPVLAKPAEQTPLIAWRAVQLCHEGGVPRGVLQLLPGLGETVGAALCADPRVRGVMFTGSTDVARQINGTLAARAARDGADIPLIAETGGQNALIADSSALPEQVVQDVLASAFDSAGQRCSALRVLFLQEEIADKTLALLEGALRELSVGVPDRLTTDIGPVIDAAARDALLAHIARMQAAGRRHVQLALPDGLAGQGTYVPPTLLEIRSMAELRREVFGPVLHVLRYRRSELPDVVEAINATGYGLTLGVHSRIDETIAFITSHARVGNVYVNRNIVGAVVGVQPFGGEGLSGTGPKAGGPLILKRLQQDAPPLLRRSPRSNPALEALRDWARGHGHADLEPVAAGYLATALDGIALDLPGPTGERNQLRFDARGHVLCAASSVPGLLNQLAAVLATGNDAVVVAGPQAAFLASLPAAVRAHVHIIDDAALEAGPLALALLEMGSDGGLRTRLAARPGAIVGIVDTAGWTAIPLWRLAVEKAVCVNTTAAGGNASLMTMGL